MSGEAMGRDDEADPQRARDCAQRALEVRFHDTLRNGRLIPREAVRFVEL